MAEWMTGRGGNPSGAHSVARAARGALDDARDEVAGHLGVTPAGVVFTSGGTESDNLAIGGVLADRKGVVVTCAGEHPAVLHAAAAFGAEVRTVPLDGDGVVDLERLAAALDGGVDLVSVMLVNNEVGTIQPLDAVADLIDRRAPAALLHTDAVQATPWLDVASAARRADLISVSAHKFGGPQGVGALALRPDVALSALTHGGGQERQLRSGTHNVAGAVGMAAALRAATARRSEEAVRVGALRDRLADGLLAAVAGSAETGDRSRKVAGNCHLRFPDVEAEALLVLLDEAGVCASAGSSCASGAMEPSHVLMAMGVGAVEARRAVRFSLGWTSDDDDVARALAVVPAAAARLRGR